MKKNLLVTFMLACGFIVSGCEPNSNGNELSAYPKNGLCAIDVPASNTTLSATEDFLIGGWVFDKTTNSTADALTIYFRDTKTNQIFSVTAKTGHHRPDVAAALNISTIENSGFNAVMEKGKLTRGTYEILLMQINDKKGAILCDNEPHLITIN